MRWLILTLPIALGSCLSDAPEIKSCEKSLISRLKAPSTYKRVSAATSAFPDAKNPKTISVDIEYDAVNSFNAPIRSREHCVFSAKNGKAEIY